MRKISYAEAINEALKEEMRRDEKVIVYGQDVAEMGGIFTVTKGILDEFGEDRIFSTPIVENMIAGGALGASIGGLRPVAELMYGDFLLSAFAEIFHSIPKFYPIHKEYKTPLVIRTAEGHAHGAGAEHSNCLETLFMHSPGLHIVVPSTPYDAKGLLKSAIRQDRPLLFFEQKMLYQTKGEVPEEEYLLPIGKADVKRVGTDITLISFGFMVKTSLEAAEELSKEGINAEVVDLRSLAPLDKGTIFESVKKTHRVVFVEESNKTNGVGAEISSLIHEEVFDYLDAPVSRVAALDCPIPYHPLLEEAVIPQVADIIAAVKALV